MIARHALLAALRIDASSPAKVIASGPREL